MSTLLRLLISAGPILALLLVAVLKPRLASNWFRPIERSLAHLARHRRLSITLIGLLAFATSATISLLVQMPHPWGHDEFSYLLAADTFAHGRLANPPHPLWVHFESFHIIQQPTYSSKFPPAQGLVLAIGQVLFGLPIVGAWLSHALACAAIVWMLMAWLPPRWALFGGLLAVIHPTMLWWSWVFMGGAVAAFGGALLLGALARMMAAPRRRDAIFFGVGMAVLLNSRPYEGMVLTLLSCVAFIMRMAKPIGSPFRLVIRRVLLPVSAVAMLTATAMGYYNYRVTGDPLITPYLVHSRAYMIAPIFAWQQARPEPLYRHKEIRNFHRGWELETYLHQRSFSGWMATNRKKLEVVLYGLFPVYVFGLSYWVLVVPLATMPWALRHPGTRLALFIALGFIGAELLVNWINVHYMAPIFGLALLLIVQSLRHIRIWHIAGKPVSLFLFRAAITLCVVSLIPTVAQLRHFDEHLAWAGERARLLANLKHDGLRHLVIVRYGPQHSPQEEWVYNEADIDAAPVVWAREMDDAQNRKLLTYFKDRHVWLLEADASPRRLVPYPIPAGL